VIVGTYSSIFLATPLLVTLRERTEKVRIHTRRVLNRRKPAAAKAAEATSDAEPEAVGAASLASKPAPPEKPAPGARPVRPASSRTGRPSGKRSTRRR
jgi:preprotein translocase subunit SecF